MIVIKVIIVKISVIRIMNISNNNKKRNNIDPALFLNVPTLFAVYIVCTRNPGGSYSH